MKDKLLKEIFNCLPVFKWLGFAVTAGLLVCFRVFILSYEEMDCL